MASPDRQQRLAALRHSIADIERKPALAEKPQHSAVTAQEFPKPVAGMLVEIFTAERTNAGAALGFALAQAKSLLTHDRPAIIFLQLADEGQKLGLPYGPGLISFGLDPASLILVRAASVRDLLWAVEEAVACRSIAGVIAEIASYSKLLDFTASRRLSLRAAATGGAVFMVRYGLERQASAAHLRWRVTPFESALQRFDPHAPGPLRWEAAQEKGHLPQSANQFLLGWTDDGFTTFHPHATPRRTLRTAVSGAPSALLADRLSQTA